MDKVRFWTPDIRQESRADGTILVWQDGPLAPWPRAMTESLLHWAATTPERVWLAERAATGWRETTYQQAAQAVQGIGSALVARGLSEQNPVLILSGNSVAHALMALGAQHVGIPSAALAPAYSLSGGDYLKLRDIAAQLTPGLIFADDADKFAPAIKAVFGADVPVVSLTGGLDDREILAFDHLRATPHSDAMRAAHDAITGDTVAKFLFTSGTTGSPKAVIQTHGMLCANQQMVRQCFAFMQDTPPVVIDWAPWNHTASGNKVFNMVLRNGGSYFIDDGKPTPQGIARTIENLRTVQPTWYFNVPLGYQMLLDAFEADRALRDSFFARAQTLMYAGAGMAQPVWDRLHRVAAEAGREDLLITTGFGATETGPFCLMCTEKHPASGNLGIPAHGVTLKLVPQGDKLEARVKSPSITLGYWRNEELTAQAFDEEGFYMFGDALKFATPGDAAGGFLFDGRLAENFKLASGTWVAVGPLRARLTDDLGGLASDAVIAGEGHETLGALITPNWAKLREIAGEDLSGEALLAHHAVRHATAEALHDHARKATGSASRITRLIYIASPLDFDKGEVTDKGSINQRAVLRHRADLVASLWSDDPRVIELGTE